MHLVDSIRKTTERRHYYQKRNEVLYVHVSRSRNSPMLTTSDTCCTTELIRFVFEDSHDRTDLRDISDKHIESFHLRAPLGSVWEKSDCCRHFPQLAADMNHWLERKHTDIKTIHDILYNVAESSYSLCTLLIYGQHGVNKTTKVKAAH